MLCCNISISNQYLFISVNILMKVENSIKVGLVLNIVVVSIVLYVNFLLGLQWSGRILCAQSSTYWAH